jgi:hypothetical protein
MAQFAPDIAEKQLHHDHSQISFTILYSVWENRSNNHFNRFILCNEFVISIHMVYEPHYLNSCRQAPVSI